MVEMANCYINMDHLFASAETEIAELTRNENACITAGAAAAMVTVVIAALSGGDPARAESILAKRVPTAIAIPSDHWIAVSHGLRLTGAEVRQLDLDRNASIAEIAAALRGIDVTIVLADWEISKRIPPLASWVAAARSVNCPIIVDAAAELPPVENLWRFTREIGFDAAVFSGGKDLGAPPGTGFIVGRTALIQACQKLRFPQTSVLRPFKVGKEEVAGLVMAIKHYISLDHAARREIAEAIIGRWKDSLASEENLDLQLVRDPQSGMALWLDLKWANDGRRPSTAAVQKLLLGEDPGIACALGADGQLRLTSWCLVEPEDEHWVLASIRRHIQPYDREP
jgi:D-glucosaminate-6-phosphate ammonia-lyase